MSAKRHGKRGTAATTEGALTEGRCLISVRYGTCRTALSISRKARAGTSPRP